MYLKEVYSKMVSYSKIKSIFTIHNLQYQGNFEPATVDMLGVPACYGNGGAEFYGCASYMKMGLHNGQRGIRKGNSDAGIRLWHGRHFVQPQRFSLRYTEWY